MIVTREDVLGHPAGEPFVVSPGTLLTSSAREYLAARRSEVLERGPAAAAAENCECGGTTSCDAAPTGAGAATGGAERWVSPLARRGVDPELWRPLVDPAAARARPTLPSKPVDDRARTLGPRETHLDGCYLGGGPCDQGEIVVVTAVGRNRPHVLAELATGIADVGGDIQEISQRVVDGFFHTILTVDMTRAPGRFAEAKQALEGLSREGDYRVRVQHEKVFQYMHRI